MPAYNFRKEFSPMIKSGRKPHTIRKCRKRPTKRGDKLFLYTGMRTKYCEKIAEAVCTNVLPVTIYPTEKRIELARAELGAEDVKDLAYRDGFDDVDSFFAFFRLYGKNKLTGFEMIYWDLLEKGGE